MHKTNIIFATNNAHKVSEMQLALGEQLDINSLHKAGIEIEIPEPHDSLEANASEKSRTIHQLTGMNCFSEDTGLEVNSLGGAPGVRSARFAGDHASAEDNINLLLQKLQGQEDRSAQFRTVISLIWNKKEYFFEGICKGQITFSGQGENGFGYDPVFIPDGAIKRFAEMTGEEKNQYSHRRKAADLLVAFLQSETNPQD